MKKPDEKIIPVRIEADLDQKIQEASELTKLSKQDIMRLCMRIGLVDLKAAEHDLPGIVKKIADDKGVSFQQFAKSQSTRKSSGEVAAQFLEPQVRVMKVSDPGDSELLWGDQLLDTQFEAVVKKCVAEGKKPPQADDLGSFHHRPKPPEIEAQSFIEAAKFQDAAKKDEGNKTSSAERFKQNLAARKTGR